MSGPAKIPPAFKEDGDYEEWKKDLEYWRFITDVPKEKMAVTIHLSLSGRARQATSEIDSKDLMSEKGLKILLSKLDRVFMQDENWKCFNTYLAFENYRREEDTTMENFLSEFDRRYHKLRECKVELPDAVVACRLIKSCNLSDMHFQLALSTTPKMTFEDMRQTLKKIFAENGKMLSGSHGKDSDLVKQAVNPDVSSGEVMPALYGEQYSGRPQRYAGNRGRGRGGRRGNNQGRGQQSGRGGRWGACFVCGSTSHWARECPRGYTNRGEYYAEDSAAGPASDAGAGDEVHITLMASDTDADDEVHVTLMASASDFTDKASALMGESIGSIVLDSGCSRTVCGEDWLNCFVETLTEDEKKTIKRSNSKSVFRFGDGRKMESQQCVVFPCILGGKAIKIKTDVVKCNIPLLLSKASMKNADMIMNMKTDTVSVFGKTIKLNTTSLGHYVLPIYRCPSPKLINDVLMASSSSDHKQIASKLHRQFAHPSAERLSKLLRDAGRKEPQLHEAVEEISAKCDICKRYKRVRPRPVVSMPIATTFNGTLAMDLKTLHGKLLFVMVDLCTRYCVARVIPNKTANTVAETIFNSWICYFGAPRQIFSDNGGEFNNDLMRILGDFYNIRMTCTAAESPWSNGACERLNAILSISTQRVLDDLGCSMEVALAWSVAARNTLHNFSGFSPAQLVLGFNPAYPNLVDADPPALENVDNSSVIAHNLNAMHSARREFMKCEYDERIRRALLHQVREDDAKEVSMGDSVYFNRQDNKWHGPGKVIGRDGKQILVKQGGAVIRVHSFRIQGVTAQEHDTNTGADCETRENTMPGASNNAIDDEEEPVSQPFADEITSNSVASNEEASDEPVRDATGEQ